MPASPICEVKDGANPWVATTDGVDVTPANTISIRLEDSTDVVEWYLRIFGTDELIPAAPTLTDVNPLTNKVTTPTTVVTFSAPVTTGHALLFESVVVTTTQTIPTTFGVYELADNGLRVGAVEETREGSVAFGWAKTVNEGIRSIGSGFTAGGDLSGTSSSQTVIGLQGRALASTAPADGNGLVWNAGLSQWEPGAGGGGTLDGDVTGPALTNVVEAIHGMSTPDPAGAAVDDVFKVVDTRVNPFTTPRPVVSDGTYLYVAESAQNAPGTGFVWKVQPSGESYSVVASANLASVDPNINFVRDLAQDATYLYATCWDTGHIAIIDKATMTIAGWGWAGAIKNRMVSVCADGAGFFYVANANRGSGFDGVRKYSTAACLGQPIGTVSSVADLPTGGMPRKVRYGGGKVWMTRGGAEITRIDPVTLTVEDTATLIGDNTMSSLYAFGSIWVSYSNAGVARLDPMTLGPVSGMGGSGNNLDELVVGPAADGTPDARIFVTRATSYAMDVFDPNTNTLETTLNPSDNTDNRCDGMGVVNGRLWTATYVNWGAPGVYDLWWVYPDGGSYTTGGAPPELALHYEPGFVAGKDLSGTNLRQTVEALKEMTVPDPSTAVDGYALTAEVVADAEEPRRVAVDPNDGTLWVADNDAPWVFQVDPSTGNITNSIDVDSIQSGVSQIRDIAVDDDYVYVSTWDFDHILQLYKWGGVRGRAYTQDRCLFLALDGAGNIYATCGTGTGAPNGVQKFSISSMAFQSLYAYTYDDIYSPPTQVRYVTYGGGYLWVTNAGHGSNVFKVDPTTMGLAATGGPYANSTLDAAYGFGYLWVTSDGDDTLTQIDPTTMAELNILSLPDESYGVCVGPDDTGAADSWIWVANGNGASVWGIDPATPTAIAMTIPGDLSSDSYDGIIGLGSKIWAVNRGGAQPYMGLRQFDPVTGIQSSNAALNPINLVFAPGGGGGEVTATHSGSTIYPTNAETVSICTSYASRRVYLPTPLADGEKHTIVDGANYAHSTSYTIRIYNQSYAQIARIMTDGGSITCIWSTAASKWVFR